MATKGGNVRLTASGAVGTSGKPTRIFSYSFLSGATAGVVIFKDQNNSGVEKHEQTGTINVGTTVQLGVAGKFFPNGAYCVVDANTTYVDIDYIQEIS